VLPAGELVVFGAGVALVLGAAGAMGVGLGDGDFLVAAETAIGVAQAKAATQAAMVNDLFFMD
jgi:F420-0:gamma-glutamyl ligase-like protein